MDDLNLDLKIDFTEEDLNDPLLLAELAELVQDEAPIVKEETKGVSTKSKGSKAEAPPPKQEINIVEDVLATLDTIPVLAEFEEIGDVEVTEEDMNDPHLLAELRRVAGTSEEGHDVSDSKGVNQYDNQPMDIMQPSGGEFREESLDSKLKLTNIQMLQQYVQIEKVSAVNKKRQGDKAGALDSLRNAKELSKRIEELQGVNVKNNAASPESVLIAGHQGSNHEQSISSNSKKGDNLPAISTNKNEMNGRYMEYKKAALSYKKNGQAEKAKEMLTIAKSIQQAIDADNDEFQLPNPPQFGEMQTSTHNDLKKHNTCTVMESNSQAPLTSASSTNLESPGQELISHLISTLDQQIELCTKLSAQYFTSNQKDLALDFHKRKKNLLQDKDTLLALKSVKFDPQVIPFKFNYSLLEYHVAQSNPELSLDQLEISITKGTDVMVKGENEPETGLLLDFGWPPTQSGTSSEGKFETKTAKGTNPNYDFRSIIKIERTKAFQRFLERKKATVELFSQSKSFFGMVSRRDMIGKAAIKLDELLTKCEIHQFVPITDPSNPRRNTGAKVEVFIKLKVPLLKADIVKTSQKWLEIVFGETASKTSSGFNNTAQIPLPAPASSPEYPKRDRAMANQEVKQASIIVKENEKSVSEPHKKALSSLTAEEDIEDLENSFLSPDNIASNAVLESEHQLLLQKIASTHPPSDDILDLKNGYEIKMQMLVTCIQMGTLDMAQYLATVKEAIHKTKIMALEFKKHGKLDLAKQAMTRIKIMTSEVKEVEEGQ